MPFFDRNKFICSVELEPPHPSGKGKYVQGSFVSGRVLMTVTATCEVRGVVLTYAVLEKLGFVAGVNPQESGCFNVESLRGHMSKVKRLRDTHVLLVGSRDGKPISIAAGSYAYPFSFAIAPDHPPSVQATVLGKASVCCKCCCECCGRGFAVAEIEHKLSCEIIIPFSLLDKNDIFKTFEVGAVHRGGPHFGIGSPQASHLKPALMCFECCECLAFLAESSQTSFSVSVADRVVALANFPNLSIRYCITGIIQESYRVVLRRQTRMMQNCSTLRDELQPGALEAEEIVFSQQLPPKLTGGDVWAVLPLFQSPLFSSGSLAPTVVTPRLAVTYELEVMPDYTGVCSGLPRRDRAIVNIVVCFDEPLTTSAAPQSFEQQQFFGRGYEPPMVAQTQGCPPPFQPPEVHCMPQLRPVAYGDMGQPSEQWFGYVPPLGYEGTFRPAGPMTETLQAPIWGIPIASGS